MKRAGKARVFTTPINEEGSHTNFYGNIIAEDCGIEFAPGTVYTHYEEGQWKGEGGMTCELEQRTLLPWHRINEVVWEPGPLETLFEKAEKSYDRDPNEWRDSLGRIRTIREWPTSNTETPQHQERMPGHPAMCEPQRQAFYEQPSQDQLKVAAHATDARSKCDCQACRRARTAQRSKCGPRCNDYTGCDGGCRG